MFGFARVADACNFPRAGSSDCQKGDRHGLFRRHIYARSLLRAGGRLVEILANETHLTVIDPLEIPPMGNCNLREIKQKYGDKIVLKGNLHTTDVMLKGQCGASA